MSNHEFITGENVEMIWDIILDTDLIKSKQNINITQMRHHFIDQMKKFYEKSGNMSSDLTQMNKGFISLVIKDIQQILDSKPLPTLPSSSPVTAQDIQSERKTAFDKNLNKKQEEFMEAMSVPVPQTPIFNDKMDEPIGGNMSELIARTLAQRNFEMDQFQKNTQNKADVENWLKPAETSIKPNTSPTPTQSQPQPQLQLQMPQQQYQPHPQPIKYIKIGENLDDNIIIKINVVDLNSFTDVKDVSPFSLSLQPSLALAPNGSPQNEQKGTLKKVLSWDKNSPEFINPRDNIELKIEDDVFSNNIFAKLKPLQKPMIDVTVASGLGPHQNIQVSNELNELKLQMKQMNDKFDALTEQINQIYTHFISKP